MSLFLILGCVILTIIILVVIGWLVVVIFLALRAYKLRAAILDRIANDPFVALDNRRKPRNLHYATR